MTSYTNQRLDYSPWSETLADARGWTPSSLMTKRLPDMIGTLFLVAQAAAYAPLPGMLRSRPALISEVRAAPAPVAKLVYLGAATKAVKFLKGDGIKAGVLRQTGALIVALSHAALLLPPCMAKLSHAFVLRAHDIHLPPTSSARRANAVRRGRE